MKMRELPTEAKVIALENYCNIIGLMPKQISKTC